jgi:membrane protein YdbS with pleckstrin-like domain
MSDNNLQKNKIPSLSEIQAQLKAKKVEALTPENKGELKNIFIISILVLISIVYIYNNPFNFTSILGIVKFIQLLLILFIAGTIFKLKGFMFKFKEQADKIQDIYSKKTIVK